MKTRLEIRKVDGLWCVGMNGVIVSSSHFKALANKVVEDVIRFNPDVEFEVVDGRGEKYEAQKTSHC